MVVYWKWIQIQPKVEIQKLFKWKSISTFWKPQKTNRRHGAGEKWTPGAPFHENNGFLFFSGGHLIPADHICCSHLSNSTATHLVSLSSSCTPPPPRPHHCPLIHWFTGLGRVVDCMVGFFSVLLRADNPSITKSSCRLNYRLSSAVYMLFLSYYANMMISRPEPYC